MAVLNLQENLELFVLFLRYSLEWVVIETRKKFLNSDIKGFRVYCCDDLNGVYVQRNFALLLPIRCTSPWNISVLVRLWEHTAN